jgi:hypothetical protein
MAFKDTVSPATNTTSFPLTTRTPQPKESLAPPILSSPLPAPTQLPESVVTNTNPSSIVITPLIKNITHSDRIYPLSELGIPNDELLIFRDMDNHQLMTISGNNHVPQPIPNIPPSLSHIDDLEVSPNLQWLAYYIPQDERDDNPIYELWVSSVDGSEQWALASDIRGPLSLRWLNNELIELWDFSLGIRGCPKRVLALNPFTKEMYEPIPHPRSPRPLCGMRPFTNPDWTQYIFLDHDNVWKLYDPESEISEAVFPWLTGEDVQPSGNKYFSWTSDGITLILPRANSIDLVVDLPVKSIDDPNVSMTTVMLPFPNEINSEFFPWWSVDAGILGFDILLEDYNDNLEEVTNTRFLLLDYKNNFIYDYALDRADFQDERGVRSATIYSSANGKYLAWSIDELPGIRRSLGTIILDIETGRLAQLDIDYELVGWGRLLDN